MRINSKIHAALDYVFVAFMLLAPLLLNLPETAAMISLAIAVVHFFFSAATDYEFGIVKSIPFRAHGLAEVGMALIFGFIAYWIYGCEGEYATRFFIAIAAWTLFAFLATDFKEKSRAGLH